MFTGIFSKRVLVKQLFKKRRLEQLNAVNRLIIKDGYEKQFKMVTIIASKIFNVSFTKVA